MGKTTYTKTMAKDICDAVSDGSNLEQIGKKEGFPTKQTIYKWLNDIDGFFDEYTRARQNRAAWRAADMDQTVQDLKDGRIDYQTARIALDNHKWQAGKENPKVYGDKIQQEHTGSVTFSGMMDELYKSKD